MVHEWRTTTEYIETAFYCRFMFLLVLASDHGRIDYIFLHSAWAFTGQTTSEPVGKSTRIRSAVLHSNLLYQVPSLGKFHMSVVSAGTAWNSWNVWNKQTYTIFWRSLALTYRTPLHIMQSDDTLFAVDVVSRSLCHLHELQTVQFERTWSLASRIWVNRQTNTDKIWAKRMRMCADVVQIRHILRIHLERHVYTIREMISFSNAHKNTSRISQEKTTNTQANKSRENILKYASNNSRFQPECVYALSRGFWLLSTALAAPTVSVSL